MDDGRWIVLYYINPKHYGIAVILDVEHGSGVPSKLHLPARRYNSLDELIEDIPEMLICAERVLSLEEERANRNNMKATNSIAQAMGVKTLAELHRIAKKIHLNDAKKPCLEIIPLKRLERGHIRFDNNPSEYVDASNKTLLKDAISRAFERATNLSDWRKTNPRRVKKKLSAPGDDYYGPVISFDKGTGHVIKQIHINLAAESNQALSVSRYRIKKTINNLSRFVPQNRDREDIAEYPVVSREVKAVFFALGDEKDESSQELQMLMSHAPFQALIKELELYSKNLGVTFQVKSAPPLHEEGTKTTKQAPQKKIVQKESWLSYLKRFFFN